uniref:G-protein coupled receptors family 1 profile domain-containing protein n=1 Tax=Amphimedon queenslandica TaxID=400682 RepID=A0A1X7U4I7_AMPQE
MDDSDYNTTFCNGTDAIIIIDIVIKEVFGGLGVIACTVALVFAIVSRFYKDIVQRLILYKLIAMLIYSLSLFMLRRYDDSTIYKAMIVVIPLIVYCANLVFTFWLTIVLHFCIVHLKELKNFKKLEPIAIITSFLPLAIAVYIPFASFDTCTQIMYITFAKKASNKNYGDYPFIIGCSLVGILYFIISILVVIIFIVTIRRSRIHHQRQDDNEAESLLVTNNKWKTLSKQLLPLVVYPIVNTVTAMVFLPLLFFTSDISNGVYLYSLVTSSGLITGIIVLIHMCTLKCKKKQKEMKKLKQNYKSQGSFCVASNNHDDIFTRETVASTNACTTYQYPCTSSLATDDQLVTLPIN